MKRSVFIASLLGAIGIGKSQQKRSEIQAIELGTPTASATTSQNLKRFYVTGGRRLDPNQNDCNVSPLVCYGHDRLDALTRSGVTVWEAEEWEKFSGKTGEKWAAICREQEKQLRGAR